MCRIAFQKIKIGVCIYLTKDGVGICSLRIFLFLKQHLQFFYFVLY